MVEGLGRRDETREWDWPKSVSSRIYIQQSSRLPIRENTTAVGGCFKVVTVSVKKTGWILGIFRVYLSPILYTEILTIIGDAKHMCLAF